MVAVSRSSASRRKDSLVPKLVAAQRYVVSNGEQAEDRKLGSHG